MMEKLIRNENEAIEAIKANMPTSGYQMLRESLDMAIQALEEIQQYREIGTVEECRKSVREDEVLKFYYCESEDDYYIGKRMGNLYYARYRKTGFEWFMSRYLPWGEHVVAPHTLWKEHTYPTEPKEIPFFEWLQDFLKKYCGGTVEECRKAREKLPVAEEAIRKLLCSEYGSSCQFCIHDSDEDAVCCNIGGSGSWCCKNAKWNGRLE